jgi:hypothetical protein
LTASPQLSPRGAELLPPLVLESAPARPPRKVRRMGEALGLALLFAFSVEAACRIEDWVQYRTPILGRERSQLDLLVRDATGMHGRAGGRFQKWSLNGFGMRGPDVTRTKPPGIVRIVTAGASETFGLYESPEHEYPRQLEDSLNVQFGRCGQIGAQVLNAAMPGMSLPTIKQDLRLRVSPLKPDFVVLYATPAAYLEDAVPTAARPDSAVGHPAPLPMANAFFPRVADRVRAQLKSVIPTFVLDLIRRRQIRNTLRQHQPNWRFDSVPAERVTAFESDLRSAIGTIRSIGAMPVLVTHANRFAGSSTRDIATLRMWEKFYPRASGQTIVAFDAAARLATIAVARDSQAILVDLPPIVARSGKNVFADYAHFTDAGAALVAASVSRPITDAERVHLPAACASPIAASSGLIVPTTSIANALTAVHRVASAPRIVAGQSRHVHLRWR